jgi:hypothetical protein
MRRVYLLLLSLRHKRRQRYKEAPKPFNHILIRFAPKDIFLSVPRTDTKNPPTDARRVFPRISAVHTSDY